MMSFENIMRVLAGISLIIGAVECFAGLKIMKATLMLWGFFVGAMLGVVIGVASDSTALGIAAVVVLGIGMAVLSFQIYLAGVFIFTAFLTTIAIYIICQNTVAALLFAAVAGVLAMCFVKPVVIITTSFSGAGIILSSAYIMMDMGLNGSTVMTVVLWIPIALAGMVCQYITTPNNNAYKSGGKKPLKSRNPSRTFSERRYPGMQRAYRNFCIKCGCELFGTMGKCPRCGFSFDD